MILACLIYQIEEVLAEPEAEGLLVYAHSQIIHRLAASGWYLHHVKKYSLRNVVAAQLQAPRLIHATNPAFTKATDRVDGHY